MIDMRALYEAGLISEQEYLDWLYDDDSDGAACCPYYPNCGHEL